MTPRLSFPAILTLICLAAPPAPCAAEPIAVTGGFLQVHTKVPGGFFTFEGDDFFLQASFDGVFGSFGLACDFCSPGTPIDLDSEFRILLAPGSAVVDGTTYSKIWVDGTALSFQTPLAPITGSASRLLTVPFTFDGVVHFFAVNPNVEPSDPVFSASLSGSGRASAFFHYVADFDVFDAQPEIRYDFAETDPVPEPATLLLCGFGTAALGLINRRRKRPSTGR